MIDFSLVPQKKDLKSFMLKLEHQEVQNFI
jgi:hypothetical protein